MLADLITVATALLFMYAVAAALVITIPQLVAAWAVVSRRPLPPRLLAVAGVWAVFWTFSAPMHEYAFPVLIGLGMLAVALPLRLVRLIGENQLRFSLRDILLAITACAALLGLFIQPAIRDHLPPWPVLVLGGIFSTTTLMAIWATLSRRPKWQRVIDLGVWVFGCSMSLAAGNVLGPGFDWQASWLLTASLAYHALLVVGVTILWARVRAQRKYYEQLLQRIPGREEGAEV